MPTAEVAGATRLLSPPARLWKRAAWDCPRQHEHGRRPGKYNGHQRVGRGEVVPTATVTHEVESYLGARADSGADASRPVQVAVPGGAVSVNANGTMTAEATANGFGVAGLDVRPCCRRHG